MKVYEMRPNEIGEAVETADAIVVTLHEPNKENRVLVISRRDMTVSNVKVDIIKTDGSSNKKNLGDERGGMVKKDGNHVVYKNVLDEFRHAKTDDEMMSVIKKFYPLYKPRSMDTMVYVYKRAVAEGVISIPVSDIVMEKRKYTRHKKKTKNDMKYLPIKADEMLGKSIGGTVALNVYKRYGTRLWNNPTADVMSRVNSSKEDVVSTAWMRETLRSVLDNYHIHLSDSRYNAYVMFLRDSGLITARKSTTGYGEYVVKRAPEIPKTIST